MRDSWATPVDNRKRDIGSCGIVSEVEQLAALTIIIMKIDSERKALVLCVVLFAIYAALYFVL